jgi:hypothetical protein
MCGIKRDGDPDAGYFEKIHNKGTPVKKEKAVFSQGLTKTWRTTTCRTKTASRTTIYRFPLYTRRVIKTPNNQEHYAGPNKQGN